MGDSRQKFRKIIHQALIPSAFFCSITIVMKKNPTSLSNRQSWTVIFDSAFVLSCFPSQILLRTTFRQLKNSISHKSKFFLCETLVKQGIVQIPDLEAHGPLTRHEVRLIKSFNHLLYLGHGRYPYLNNNFQIEKIKAMQGERTSFSC